MGFHYMCVCLFLYKWHNSICYNNKIRTFHMAFLRVGMRKIKECGKHRHNSGCLYHLRAPVKHNRACVIEKMSEICWPINRAQTVSVVYVRIL